MKTRSTGKISDILWMNQLDCLKLLQNIYKIRWYNLQEPLLWIKKRTLTFFVASGLQLEGNAAKIGEPK